MIISLVSGKKLKFWIKNESVWPFAKFASFKPTKRTLEFSNFQNYQTKTDLN
jgi:hypothetical protein